MHVRKRTQPCGPRRLHALFMMSTIQRPEGGHEVAHKMARAVAVASCCRKATSPSLARHSELRCRCHAGQCDRGLRSRHTWPATAGRDGQLFLFMSGHARAPMNRGGRLDERTPCGEPAEHLKSRASPAKNSSSSRRNDASGSKRACAREAARIACHAAGAKKASRSSSGGGAPSTSRVKPNKLTTAPLRLFPDETGSSRTPNDGRGCSLLFGGSVQGAYPIQLLVCSAAQRRHSDVGRSRLA